MAAAPTFEETEPDPVADEVKERRQQQPEQQGSALTSPQFGQQPGLTRLRADSAG